MTASLTSVASALSDLLWPILVAATLWVLLPELRKVVRSRSWSLKVGGMELSVQEASDQLHRQVKDLQEQVSALRDKSDGKGAIEPDEPRDATAAHSSMSQHRRIAPATESATAGELLVDHSRLGSQLLWVDDQPANNAYEVETLREMGWQVRLETTTDRGLEALEQKRGQFAVVVTDLGRSEYGTYRPDAGLELLTAVRSQHDDVPVLVYTSIDAAKARGEELLEAGATAVTASPTLLLNEIRLRMPLTQ